MSNCRCSCSSILLAIWSFLLGSLRFILFFGCLYLILNQLITLRYLLMTDEFFPYMPTELRVGNIHYVYAMTLLVVGLVGAYGAFFKHHPSIKAFAILTAVSSGLFILLMIGSMSTADLDKAHHKLHKQLEDYQHDYEWANRSSINYPNTATKAWNALQSFACCGINRPSDWDKYRPKSLEKELYPSSCCSLPVILKDAPSTDKFCLREKSSQFFETGCMKRLEQFEYMIIRGNVTYIGFQLFLSIAACIITGMHLTQTRPNTPQQRLIVTEPMWQQQYQYYEGPTYMRQPPLNDTYKPTPYYPNPNFVAAPPSYGTQ